jgi:hypothetical protein
MPGAMPWHHRYIGNPILSGLGRLLYRTPCRDWHCGLRAFDREKIQALNLKAPGMEFASEMVIRASQGKLRMGEIPIHLHPDGRSGPPHLRSFRDGARHVKLILSQSKTFVLLTVILLFSALSLFVLFRTTTRSQNSTIRIDRNGTFAFTLNVRDLTAGERISRDIEIRNQSSVAISNPERIRGCSCLRYTLEPPIIPPSGRGVAKILFTVPEIIGRFGATASGRISPTQMLQLELTGNSVPSSTSTPNIGTRTIDFGTDDTWFGELGDLDEHWEIHLGDCEIPSSIVEIRLDNASTIRTGATTAIVKVDIDEGYVLSGIALTEIAGDEIDVSFSTVDTSKGKRIELRDLGAGKSPSKGILGLHIDLQKSDSPIQQSAATKTVDLWLPFVFLNTKQGEGK